MTQQTSECFYLHVQRLEACSEIPQVKKICEDYLRKIGAKFFKYAWNPPAITTKPKTISFNTCPEPWLNHCSQKDYPISDPQSHYCEYQTQPILWNEKSIRHCLNSIEFLSHNSAFWNHNLNMGLANGATIPIRGIAGSKGMFCIAYQGAHVNGELAPLPLFEAWVMHLHNQIEHIYIQQQLAGPLSEREQEVLKWTVIGKTAKEIADILHISSNTVLFHLSNLRRRLNVSNKHHLIARAFTLRLVEL